MGRTLQEDLEKLGIKQESILTNIGMPGKEVEEGNDPLDGEYVTKGLLDRLEALPFEAMEESDFQEIMDELAEKKLPDGDDELREQAERVVVMLKEGINGRCIDEGDPIDGLYVTKELFDRIEALPFEAMEDSDFEELLDELAEKKLPEGDDELREQAERVVVVLKEGVANRQRRFKGGSTARKMSFQCPQGFRAVSGDGGRPMCKPSHIAAGGMGKLRKEGRKKKKWSRGGKGQMSKMRSFRVEKRRGAMRKASEGIMSPLAQELMLVSEGMQGDVSISVRDEIIERCVNIVEFLNEEFMDKSVTQIYDDAIEEMLDAYDVGRLDEDVMDENEFIAEIEPVISLITKSLEKLEDLGNE